MSRWPKPSAQPARRGQALVEFVFIAFIMVTLLSVTVTLGYFLFAAQTLQQAVDVAAREISRMPFAPTAELGLGRLEANDENWVMNDADFLDQIYDPQHLVVDADGVSDLISYMADKPLLNRLLVPLMIFEPDKNRYRYPGTVVMDTHLDYLTVLIPMVDYDDATGQETFVGWRAPVEEIKSPCDPDCNPSSSCDPNDDNDDYYPFALQSCSKSGLVALRINYPAQSATSLHRVRITPPGEPEQIVLTLDNDESHSDEPPSRFKLEVPPVSDYGASAGRYGLGRLSIVRHGLPSDQAVVDVRPFRKVISVQAVYRREIFE
jgi:hypothetical protein